ncbi:hypothetical protein ABZW18_10760 [Streptomyces sp. NPDC004647]|uniref:hypothetical protein n=1 Tax=Streptomyces sp. NPDC004647 TaxID=3154671 RepID=UPI0033A3F7DA
MRVDDTELQRVPGSGPAGAQEIMDSFQAVLDALDAARADLRAFDEQDWDGIPPASWRSRGEPAAGEVRGGPGLLYPAPPAEVVEPLWARSAQPENATPSGAGHPLWAGAADPPVGPPPLAGPPPAPPKAGGRHRAAPRRGLRRLTDRRETRAAGVLGVSAVGGLILASSLLVNDDSPPLLPFTPAGQPDGPPSDGPPSDDPGPWVSEGAQPGEGAQGEGEPRRGDGGQEVPEPQKRTFQVPNIYNDGETDGRYEIEVRAGGVARFQEW